MGLGRLELQGAARREALAACRSQIEEWGLALPNVEPYPLHFGLDNFPDIGEIEFWICNEEEAGYCGKFLFLFAGQTCPFHRHRIKHETFFVVKGRMRLELDEGRELTLNQGDRFAVPPGLGHAFTAVDGNLLLLEVSMPSHVWDNEFADDRINRLLPPQP